MTSLVTGGAGFIGCHVARRCLELGHEVVVLDDLSGGFRENVPDEAHFVEGSIIDGRLVARLFREHRFEYVYHLAAYAAEGLSHFIRALQLHEQRRRQRQPDQRGRATHGRRVLRVHVVDRRLRRRAGADDRDDDAAPEDPYGIAKYAVELDLAAAHEMFGLDYAIFRPHNVYGERQNIGDRYRNVIGIFMNQIMQGEPMTVFGDGTQTRAFSYIDDVAPLIARSLDVPAAANEVVQRRRRPALQRCAKNSPTMVARVFGVEPPHPDLGRANEVVHAFSSHERVVDVFGPQDYVPPKLGIERTAAWSARTGPAH